MAENPDEKLTYPVMPYSNQYIAEMKEAFILENECLDEQLKMAERRMHKAEEERNIMANEFDVVSKMVNEWMIEAVGYREQRNEAWEKIKVLE